MRKLREVGPRYVKDIRRFASKDYAGGIMTTEQLQKFGKLTDELQKLLDELPDNQKTEDRGASVVEGKHANVSRRQQVAEALPA